MGDFSAPAAAANGSSICISSSLGGAGIGVNNTPNSTPAAPSSNHPAAGCGAGGPGGGSVAVPKHSTVVERLRQRIEGCRRHHVNCENRYQQAQVEQLELERRDTVSLYQRTLEQRAKKAGAGSGKQQQQQQQPPSKAQQDAEAASAEQRNHTLIMLQETVKRKLEGARSPLNGEQQNGACDGGFSPTHKRLRRELAGGLEAVSLPLPAASPLQPLDLKPALPLAGSGAHAPAALLEDLGKNGRRPDMKLPANGCGDLDEGLPGLPSKGLKQEPLEDPAGMDPSETSLSNQNKLFSDINLNDQEWQELIDELANTVPEDDIQDLFNEDFEEKKGPEFSQPAAETPLSQESLSVKSDPTHSPFAHGSLASPQARPASSGPPFAAGPAPPTAASTPAAPNPAGSPASCAAQSPQTPNPAHGPGQAPPRPGNGYLLAPAAGPGSDLSPAEQLKQMAAQQQQRVKFMHQKQQQQQQQHSGQSASWSPLGPPSSPYGAAFTAEKPNSPLMYPQAFNNQNPIVPPMANNLQKTTMNNYLPPSPLNMVSQPASTLGANSLSKPHNLLTYGNTKPLTHFNANLNQRMTPPMANPSKNPLMPYMQPQPQPSQPPSQAPQLQAPRAHLSEEQKRLLLMKQKGVMNQPLAYASLPAHGQEHPMGLPRSAGPLQSSVPPGSGSLGSGAAPAGAGFLGSQPQAALMKQMLLDQRAQLMEQQQFLREQRQQQQVLAEQQPQQPQLARQHVQQQRSPYPVAQVGQFQGAPQDMAARSQAALQTMRPARLMAQNAGMMAMGPAQSPGSLASTAAPSDMGLYSSAPSSQPGMYNLGAGMAPMLQHPNQSGLGMAHGQAPGHRQPGAAQGAGLVSGFGQNMLVNSALAPAAQQHPQMKGPVGAALARPQAPARLPSMMGAAAQQGAAGWPQRGLQAMPGRTSGEMGAFNNGASYPLPTGQPRLGKPPFPGALGQVVDASTGAVRTLAPGAAGRQMMPGLPAQPAGGQARPLVLPGLSPALPAFGQPPAPQQLPTGGFAAAGGPAQDTGYGYGGDGAGPPFPGLPDGPDLVDSIVKGGPGDEWMQELDELFGNP